MESVMTVWSMGTDAFARVWQAALKEAWMPTTPHGREGFILAPCKAHPRGFFPSGAIHGSRARVGIFLELSSGL